MKKVLLTGATGENAIMKLLELKVPVRALVHKVDERSEKLSSQGVEIVRGDLSDFRAVSEALNDQSSRRAVKPRALQPRRHGGEGLCQQILAIGRQGVQFATFPEMMVPYYPYFSFVQSPYKIGADITPN
jgi:uncharacterized protein YbjT (DUF2867 family)